MDTNFKNIKELYDRVYPALKSKVRELKRNNIDYIKEVDIWNCLIEYRWKNMRGLVLSEVVDDILNVDNKIIEDHVKEEMKKRETEANMDLEVI